MKNLKLFPKTFLFTVSLMGSIILISHLLISILLPEFYIQEKERDISILTEKLMREVQTLEQEELIDQAQSFAKHNNLNIIVKIGEDVYDFETFQVLEIELSDDYPPIDSVLLPESIFQNQASGAEWKTNSTELPSTDGIHRLQYTLVSRETVRMLSHEEAIIYLSMDIQPIGEASGVVFKLLPYTSGISLLISFLASYFYAKALTTPIKKMRQVTSDMKELQPSTQCEVESEDEVGELASNINNLYQTLKTTIKSLEHEIKHVSEVEQQKLDFLRSASHELKTPLTRLNIMLENMIYKVGKYKDRDHYLNVCKEEVEQLNQMVYDILETSNLQTCYLKGPGHEVDLNEIVFNVLKPYELLAKSKGIILTIDLSQSFVVKIDQASFTKALSNIISNAVNYTDAHKNIKIYIESNMLSIENECLPIPKEDLNQIFKAFYHPDFSRNRHNGGNGLGLYIVKQVLSMNKLSYSFQPTDTGMRFDIIFPESSVLK